MHSTLRSAMRCDELNMRQWQCERSLVGLGWLDAVATECANTRYPHRAGRSLTTTTLDENGNQFKPKNQSKYLISISRNFSVFSQSGAKSLCKRQTSISSKSASSVTIQFRVINIIIIWTVRYGAWVAGCVCTLCTRDATPRPIDSVNDFTWFLFFRCDSPDSSNYCIVRRIWWNQISRRRMGCVVIDSTTNDRTTAHSHQCGCDVTALLPFCCRIRHKQWISVLTWA